MTDKMTDSKIYLNVPYAQKDTAKALGARWDAVVKKWFVPADKNSPLFAQWHVEVSTEPKKSISKPKSASLVIKDTSSVKSAGAMTYALDKNFVAYNGDEPPWG
jgi:Domain of unknown function (DUF5710)